MTLQKKCPIALIQGYAEGLVENVNSDEESRKFYAEVILDEAGKMDTLVKQLLELMKLEYGKREFNNTKFDIVELIKEVIRKCDVMVKEKQIDIDFSADEMVYVTADSFYIEQVITNYFTNAIKHTEEKKKVIVEFLKNKDNTSSSKGAPDRCNRGFGRFLLLQFQLYLMVLALLAHFLYQNPFFQLF